MFNSRDALELAYGKGRIKRWALEQALLDVLYNTKPENATYLKLKNLTNLDFDEETETEYLIKFGYLFIIPRTEVDLHIMKRDGQLYLTREGIGWGYERVEDEIVKYLLKHKANKNLVFQTNPNRTELLIR